MKLIIDANVFAGYFKEHVLEIKEHGLTDTTTQLFERLGNKDTTYIDANGHIVQEWKNLVEPEWFVEWYADQLRVGGIVEIPTDTCADFKKTICQFGFPKSKDFWYLKVAKKMIEIFQESKIITEDIDFYDPKMKKQNSKTRLRMLRGCDGCLAKYLRKKEDIFVYSIICYNQEIS